MQQDFNQYFQKFRSFLKENESGVGPLQETFAGQLFSHSSWFLNNFDVDGTKVILKEKVEVSIKEEKTEKIEVIESFKKFVDQKEEIKKEKPYSFKGGEISISSEINSALSHLSFLDEETDVDQKIGYFFARLERKKIVFIGDPEKKDEEDLLSKMISAMKLKDDEYAKIPFFSTGEGVDENAELQKIVKDLVSIRPEIVVTLGAYATNFILREKKRLSTIHGQFLDIKIILKNAEHNFKLVPIFHPDFLIINPKMKRTAWIDLQKVMDFFENNK